LEFRFGFQNERLRLWAIDTGQLIVPWRVMAKKGEHGQSGAGAESGADLRPPVVGEAEGEPRVLVKRTAAPQRLSKKRV
jgi:hypothetical protein